MRTSQYCLSTLRETPTDAEVISHQLMLRAGLIKKVSSGLYTWLPTGLRVLKKVEKVVREEMARAGALELLMPVVQPCDLWQESGRIEQYGLELLKFGDRHQREFCLGPTHEEVITDLARQLLQSYKQLPVNFYQIQTKFRDEIRPRFGVMRAREFTMKDAYSFHLDHTSLEATYQAMYDAYTRIFSRLGLDFRPVLADTGSIGGNASHEFHVLANSGEDAIAVSDQSDYAANVELAEAVAPHQNRPEPLEPQSEIATPNICSIEELCKALSISASQTVKTLIVEGSDEETPLVALALRGDHTLNEIKAEKCPNIKAPLTLADDTIIQAKLGCLPGSIGPCHLKGIPLIVDRSAAVLGNFTCGANRDGYHLQNCHWDRDATYSEVADLRNVLEGDPSPDGKGHLIIKRGIEVGHIFQLGTKYSEAMNASVLDENGKTRTMTMGCYGIGISRVVAAAIEQNHDEQGILWPSALAPFQVGIVGINMHKSEEVVTACEALYSTLTEQGIEVLLDDRKERPGVKFADMELMGIPHRIVISDKTLKEREVEYTLRCPIQKEETEGQEQKKSEHETKQRIAYEQVVTFLQQALN